MTRTMTSLRVLAAAAAVLCAAACTSELSSGGGHPTTSTAGGAEQATGSGQGSSSSTTPSDVPTTGYRTVSQDALSDGTLVQKAAQGTALVGSECAARAGVRIRQVADIVVPAVSIPATSNQGKMIGDQEVGRFTVPAYNAPATVVDGGCVVYHDAPGGCLGAVDITAVTVPPARVPGYSIPALTVDSSTSPGATVPAVATDGVTVPAVHQDAVCRQATTFTSGYVSPVQRSSVLRPSASRSSLSRLGASRKALVAADSTYVNSAYVSSAYVPSVDVPSVLVDSARLDATDLDKDTTVAEADDTRVYNTSTDVLFAFGKSELKPAARDTLLAVAKDITRKAPESRIRVEGHTDSVGDEASNQRLSEQRAEAVRDFLVGTGHLSASRITVKGYGETRPVYSNTKSDGSDDPQARAKNRRVVITAANG